MIPLILLGKFSLSAGFTLERVRECSHLLRWLSADKNVSLLPIQDWPGKGRRRRQGCLQTAMLLTRTTRREDLHILLVADCLRVADTIHIIRRNPGVKDSIGEALRDLVRQYDDLCRRKS